MEMLIMKRKVVSGKKVIEFGEDRMTLPKPLANMTDEFISDGFRLLDPSHFELPLYTSQLNLIGVLGRETIGALVKIMILLRR